MLKADSSTLKSESELQSRTTAPMMPRAAAFLPIELSAWSIDTTEVPGKMWLSECSRLFLEPPCRGVIPSRAMARKSIGTSEHRRQVRAAIGEELLEQAAFSYPHRYSVSLLGGYLGEFPVLAEVANKASAAGAGLASPPRKAPQLLPSARVWMLGRHSPS